MGEDMAITAYFGETNCPQVTILSPQVGMRVTNSAATFRGTASDDTSVALVEFSINGEAFQAAAGTLNWSATVNLRPGTNHFRVRSVDTFGNVSTLNTRPLFYTSPSPRDS